MSECLAWGQSLKWPEIQGGERMLLLEAGPEDRRSIARDLDLADLPRLTARVTVRPWLDGVEISGRLQAVAGRICGLSLEPFEESIDDPLLIRIVPRGSPNAPRGDGGEVVIDLDADDPPEEAEGGEIDISAYVTEAFALALDPFPRKPGAVFVAPEPSGDISPFAALAGLAKGGKADGLS